MANFYFFTDLDLIENQRIDGDFLQKGLQFGPIGKITGDEDYNNVRFNLSSIHYPKAGEQPNAYAVCEGQAIYVRVPGNITGLCNLILKPKIHPVNCPKIKYFVYRSIIDTGIPSEFILNDGYEDDFIDDVFDFEIGGIKKMEIKDELKNIGKFPMGVIAPGDISKRFGLEIMLDNYGFNPKISDVKQTSNKMENGDDHYHGNTHLFSINETLLFENSNIITNDTLPYDTNTYNKIRLSAREYVLNYLDPCAFYGNFASNDVDVVLIASNNPGPTEKVLPESIYPKILIGDLNLKDQYGNDLLSYDESNNSCLFYNRNKIYIDIRDQYNCTHLFSHANNFHEINNPIHSNIKIKWNHDTYEYELRSEYPKTYDTDNASCVKTKWPIYTINKKSDAAHWTENARYYVPSGSNIQGINQINFIYLNIFFRKTMEINSDGLRFEKFYTVCSPYRKIGNKSSQSNHEGSNFIDVSNSDGDYSDGICISIPHLQLSISTEHDNYHCISQYIRLSVIENDLELRTYPLLPDNKNILSSFEYLDNVFLPFDAVMKKWINDPLVTERIKIYENAVYVDNTRYDGTGFIADVAIAQDTTNYYFIFNKALKIGSNAISENHFAEEGIKITPLAHENILKHLEQLTSNLTHKKICYKQEIVDNKTIDILYETSPDINPTSGSYPFVDGFMAIQVSYTDLAHIFNLYTNNPSLLRDMKTFMAFRINGFYDENGKEYTKYEIILRGYEIYNDEIKVIDIPTNRFVYHLVRGINIGDKPLANDGTPGYSVHTIGNNEKIIKTKLCFIRGLNVTIQEMQNYMNYFCENVHNVWSSSCNSGLNDVVESIQMNISANQDPESIYLRVATHEHITNLQDKDDVLLISVHKRHQNARSFVSGRRRAMMFFQNATDLDALNLEQRNTAAHEFGHLMGLGDRYCSIGFLESDNLTVKTTTCPIVPLFVDDVDYFTNYRWCFNLFSSIKNVPPPSEAENQLLYHSIPTNVEARQNFFDFLTNNYNINGQKAIFITPLQWSIVANYSLETIQNSNKVVFKVGDTFNGSYIGIDTNGIVFSDEGYNPPNDIVPVMPFKYNDIAEISNTNNILRYGSTIFSGWLKASTKMIENALDVLYVNDMETGGIEKIKTLFSSGELLYKDVINYLGNPPVLHLTDDDLVITTVKDFAHDWYNLIDIEGESDPAEHGKTLWEKGTVQNDTLLLSLTCNKNTYPPINCIIRYIIHNNRVNIILILGGGGN